MSERERVLRMLEGTTPGEWSYQPGWGIQVWNEKGVGLLIYAEAGTLANVKDQDLMAAAPDLARRYADALAENARLRATISRVESALAEQERMAKIRRADKAAARFHVILAVHAALASAPEERHE